jgi:hypothetical protein
MPVLLIINRDDAFLPRGWVSAILPDGAVLSDYEKSGDLFEAVSVPDGPAFAKRAAGAPPSFSAKALIYENGEVREIAAPRELILDRIRTQGPALEPVSGPDTLDRSHSTIWDYGPGRTYSTPQAAFDALVAQVGAAPFTEVHYVRGFGGTHGQGASGYVLYLSTVNPSAAFPLVIDAEPGAQVVWDGDGGDACLIASAVSHVRVRDLKLVNAAGGVGPSDWSIKTTDWLVERVEAGSPGSEMQVGVCIFMTDHLRVRHCDLHDLSVCGVGGFPGFSNNEPVIVEVSGVRIKDCGQGIYNNLNATFLLANNTIHAASYGINHDTDKKLTLAAMINNVFVAADQAFISIYVHGPALDDFRVLCSDGNRFHPGPSNIVASLPANDLDLDAFRQWFGGDARSIITDPQLDSELAPLAGSPCLGAGASLDDAGASGKRRAESVDMGHEQITAIVPSITARREPEIARKK